MMSNRFDRIFDDMFAGSIFKTHRNSERQKTPKVNVYEIAGGYELEMKVPGLVRENIDIAVDNNVLTLSSVYSENEKYERRFELPQKVDSDNISAALEDGILTVRLPEAVEKKPQKIEILSA